MNVRHIAISLPLLFSPACGDADHGHADEGGHLHSIVHAGAVIVEIGDHFAQMEVDVDAKTGTVSLWLIDHGSAVRSSTHNVPVEVTVGTETFSVNCLAQANPVNNQTVGDSSEFKGSDERLKDADHVTGAVGTINIKGHDFSDVTFDWSQE